MRSSSQNFGKILMTEASIFSVAINAANKSNWFTLIRFLAKGNFIEIYDWKFWFYILICAYFVISIHFYQLQFNSNLFKFLLQVCEVMHRAQCNVVKSDCILNRLGTSSWCFVYKQTHSLVTQWAWHLINTSRIISHSLCVQYTCVIL